MSWTGVWCEALEQGPGEALFVPSGWYHQVHNTTDCVSINHNWLNAANARVCWAMLRDELDDVRSGLPDADDRSDGRASPSHFKFPILGLCDGKRVRGLVGLHCE